MAEIDVFRRQFHYLLVGLKHELDEVAPLLFAKDLINDSTLEMTGMSGESVGRRTTHLLRVLLDKIRSDSSSFGLILGVLDDCRLQTLTNRLRRNLKSKRSGRKKGPTAGVKATPLCDCGKAAIQQTSNTKINTGRKFYSCAQGLRGGCNFFLWADVKQRKCYCGEQAVQRTVKKEGPNKGCLMLICPKPKESSSNCKFFELVPVHSSGGEGRRGGGGSGRSLRLCSSCQKPGHNKRTCPQLASV